MTTSYRELWRPLDDPTWAGYAIPSGIGTSPRYSSNIRFLPCPPGVYVLQNAWQDLNGAGTVRPDLRRRQGGQSLRWGLEIQRFG